MSRISNNSRTVIAVSNPPPLPPGQDTQILTNVNGANQYSYPGYQYKGSDFIPSFPITGSEAITQNVAYVGPYSSNYKYFGGCVASTGKIYMFPLVSSWTGWTQNIGIFDPYTETVDTTTLSVNNVPLLTGCGFVGGVAADNGLIYGIPWNSSRIPVINPVNNSINFIEGIDTTFNKYRGGVMAPNGKIYCAPGYNFSTGSFIRSIGVIDTFTNTFSTIDISGLPVGSGSTLGYYGGAIGRNGRIYFAPHTNSGGKVLRIDPTNNDWAYIDLSGQNLATQYGANTLPDGNVMLMPFNNGRFYKIDVSTETVSAASISNRPYAIQGGCLGSDGNIYCIPGYSRDTSLSIINTLTNQVTIRGNCLPNPDPSGNNVQDIYLGSVLAPNGKIYLIPSKGSFVSSIKTGIPSLQPYVFNDNFNRAF